MEKKYSVELTEKEIRMIRNILEYKAIELEHMKNPYAKEVDRLATIFDDVLYK